ncbi:major facilitator superfamily [Micromonas commoda]|uniref:Molybdate-anion transporter n=1 Tax=Micromonas commoda (strain RCC299 / NOUM17 / CCMP2709) TaxID=296587 RepID=C1EAU9_MICCC|nr:major facilitator superfamily [Micromonas commoda]ACO64922.1 major facilitator superfamily [Micromonas commoda]|eukprot:XP_002503664.1 major facilitator superfamily [Micromonas commoda]
MHGFTTTRGQRAYGSDRGSGDQQHATFRRLRRRYNVVYTLGTFGDWIQGAYLYALYSEHGYDMASIGYIFVLGYFASASVGTYVSSLGDRYGYRRFVILYGTAYGIACLLMRSSNLVILLASRVASGVAYSLLFSSFESWAITEADRLRLDRRYLVGLFSTATFFNACSAVAAGVPSTLLFPRNKYTPAFDVGAGVLFLCALGAYKLWWEERPTGGGGRNAPERGILRAAAMVLAKPELLSLGVTNSLYEAALHVFVFVWTPALERRGPRMLAGAVPHGLVFSLFMACKMAGSQLYMIIGDRVPAATILRAVFLGSTLVFAAPLLVESYSFTLLCFCAFEFGLGLYWPAMAVTRAELVPNYLRATMTSVFRVPLNVLVMGCLAFAGNASEPSFLTMCVAMMGSCLFFTSRGRAGKGDGSLPPGSPRGIAP